MCLGVPGRVTSWIQRDPLFAQAMVEFEGVSRACHMACVPDANVGDFVIVHAGLAISLVDQAEAKRIFDELRRLDMIEEPDT